MQKPENKAVKDFIIEKTARVLQFPQDTVEEVIGWSFKKANQASHNNKEIEVSGIGKLMLSQAKLRKQIANLERMYPNLKEENKQVQVKELIEDLKTKIDVK